MTWRAGSSTEVQIASASNEEATMTLTTEAAQEVQATPEPNGEASMSSTAKTEETQKSNEEAAVQSETASEVTVRPLVRTNGETAHQNYNMGAGPSMPLPYPAGNHQLVTPQNIVYDYGQPLYSPAQNGPPPHPGNYEWVDTYHPQVPNYHPYSPYAWDNTYHYPPQANHYHPLAAPHHPQGAPFNPQTALFHPPAVPFHPQAAAYPPHGPSSYGPPVYGPSYGPPFYGPPSYDPSSHGHPPHGPPPYILSPPMDWIRMKYIVHKLPDPEAKLFIGDLPCRMSTRQLQCSLLEEFSRFVVPGIIRTPDGLKEIGRHQGPGILNINIEWKPAKKGNAKMPTGWVQFSNFLDANMALQTARHKGICIQGRRVRVERADGKRLLRLYPTDPSFDPTVEQWRTFLNGFWHWTGDQTNCSLVMNISADIDYVERYYKINGRDKKCRVPSVGILFRWSEDALYAIDKMPQFSPHFELKQESVTIPNAPFWRLPAEPDTARVRSVNAVHLEPGKRWLHNARKSLEKRKDLHISRLSAQPKEKSPSKKDNIKNVTPDSPYEYVDFLLRELGSSCRNIPKRQDQLRGLRSETGFKKGTAEKDKANGGVGSPCESVEMPSEYLDIIDADRIPRTNNDDLSRTLAVSAWRAAFEGLRKPRIDA